MTTEREPRTGAPLVGRPTRGSEVHLQHDHDIRQSLCGDGVTGGDTWDLDDLCPKCWDQARAEAAREALEAVGHDLDADVDCRCTRFAEHHDP